MNYPVTPSFLLGMAEEMLRGLRDPEFGDINRRYIEGGLERIVEGLAALEQQQIEKD